MDDHELKKKQIKKIGKVLLIIGIILDAIGFISFFSSFLGGGFPFLFFCSFIGLPITGVGLMLTLVGYKRETMKYMKDESMPVYKESYHDLKPELVDFVSTLKGENKVIICPRCKQENDDDHKFCKFCGEPLTDKRCPYCNAILDGDASFCTSCGKRI